jgi:MOSC domain-containing protein YiiM
MDRTDTVTFVEGRGIEGNADQGGYRQVTVISREVFDEVSGELGVELDPAVRRANVLIQGVDISSPRGKVLCLGEARLHIRGETKPCERMDEAVDGLRAALGDHWRGGCFGRVIRGGTVRVGDPVWLEDAPA